MNTFHKNTRLLIHKIGHVLRAFHLFYLRSTGVTIGKNCSISLRAKIDTRRGKIIIGNNCTITYNCIILAHDRSASHINPEDDGEGVVVIEDGVYVGVNSVILRNVRIGKNSVIGAGSVVNRNVPEGVVAVGNPIRIVRTIEHLKNSTGRP